VSRTGALLASCLLAFAAGAALAAGQDYQPYSGQPGKDVVWVPTPYSLGSGDGRMVALARRNAAQEGVADKALFMQGDMYEADISQASVLALFLLPANLQKLAPKFQALRPGTRIVTNGFPIGGWEAVETGDAEGDCGAWCRAYLYIVR
jgi:hypothetical protein